MVILSLVYALSQRINNPNIYDDLVRAVWWFGQIDVLGMNKPLFATQICKSYLSSPNNSIDK